MNDITLDDTSTRSVRDSEAVTEAVVRVVADEKGVSPLELEPLGAAINPDALNALFGDGSEDVTVEFAYQGLCVGVTAEGRITIDEVEEATSARR